MHEVDKNPPSSGPITPEGIAAINEPSTPDSGGVDLDNANFISQVEREKKREELTGLIQDRTERKTYAGRIFRLICCWLCGVFTLLIISGFGKSFPQELQLAIGNNLYSFKGKIAFEISDGVLLAIVGGTTATVLGLFAIVANYLFPKRNQN